MTKSNISKKRYYFWWLSTLLIATSLFWAFISGVVQKIWETDTTMLTSVISITFIAATILIGYISYNQNKKHLKAKLVKATDTVWFISEILMALGMLGTVIGLILMLGANVIGTNTQNMSNVQSLLSNMWLHMGLALYTNAVGIICSIILKLQMHFIIGDIENEK